MRFVSFGPSGEEAPGWLVEEGIVPLSGLLDGQGIEGLVMRWSDIAPQLQRWRAASIAVPPGQVRLGPPLLRPSKIMAVGANYRGLDGQPPRGPADPILFFKPVSSLVGHRDPVVLPIEAASVVAEVELTIVVGKGGHRIAPADAMKHVFGYTIANDITAPEVMLGDSHESPLFFQQGRGKGFPTFCPLGPWIVTADEVGDPARLELEQSINGEIELSGSSALMHHSVATLLSEASHAFGLAVGDIILSGSPRPPAGAGRRPLADGDRLRSRISKVGVLENPIVAEEDRWSGQPIRRYGGRAAGY